MKYLSPAPEEKFHFLVKFKHIDQGEIGIQKKCEHKIDIFTPQV